jgi:dTMP kinase
MFIKKGIIISFEGCDGSGKTTQIKRINKRLISKGINPIVVRDPGSTKIGEKIKKLIKNPNYDGKISAKTELFLFLASRSQLVKEIINPSIKKKKIVICDRFVESTKIYQGLGRKISKKFIHDVNSFVLGKLKVDLTLILDLSITQGLKRIKRKNFKKSLELDRIENENYHFHKIIRSGYIKLAKKNKKKFLIVNGNLEKNIIELIIWKKIKSFLQLNCTI